MSFERVICRGCGGRANSGGAVHVELTLARSRCCGSCHHIQRDEHYLWFCTPGCLVRYISEHAAEFDEMTEEFGRGGPAFLKWLNRPE